MWSDSDHQYSVSGIGESAAVLAAAYNETETTEGDVAARKARKLLQASDVVADVVGEVGAHWELMTSADAKMDVIIDGQPVQQQVEHCTEHWLMPKWCIFWSDRCRYHRLATLCSCGLLLELRCKYLEQQLQCLRTRATAGTTASMEAITVVMLQSLRQGEYAKCGVCKLLTSIRKSLHFRCLGQGWGRTITAATLMDESDHGVLPMTLKLSGSIAM